MHVLRLTIFLMFTSCLAFGQRANYDSIQIWQTGAMHSYEVVGSNGQQWFGLCRVADGYNLIKSNITIAESSTVGGLYDRFVTADSPSRPLLLVRGIKGMREGPVNTLISQPTFVYPAESRSLKFQGIYYVFKAFGNAVDKQVEVLINDYELKLSVNQQSQIVAAFDKIGSDKYPQIFWAGDLDGDGKLDLVIDTSTHYSLFELTLFLSTAANLDQLVAPVASFQSRGS